MIDLAVIGFSDERTGSRAALAAPKMLDELGITQEMIAVVVRERDGTFTSSTVHDQATGDTAWGLFWSLFFVGTYLVPVLGVSLGPDLDRPMRRIAGTGIDEHFGATTRDLLQPGTSALFLAADHRAAGEALDRLAEFGGTVVQTSLTPAAERRIADTLHGNRDLHAA